MRNIAVAIGKQQRIVDERAEMDQEACNFYNRAIRSLRKTVKVGADDDEALILACLLMVILESLRGSSGNVLVHLRYGIGMLRERKVAKSEEMREAASFLRQYAVNATLFNPLSETTKSLLDSAFETFEAWDTIVGAGSGYDPVSRLWKLVMHLKHLMHFGEINDFEHMLFQMKIQQLNIEQAIDAEIRAADETNEFQLAILGIAKARCILLTVYLSSAWSGNQVTYDGELETFSQTVHLLSNSLRQLQLLDSSGKTPRCSTAFSVGIFVQDIIILLIQQCRDTDIRRHALELLDECPRHEGIFEISIVKAVCRAMIAFEERGAGDDGFIPESFRVQHYVLEESERPKEVTFLYRPVEGRELVPHMEKLVYE